MIVKPPNHSTGKLYIKTGNSKSHALHGIIKCTTGYFAWKHASCILIKYSMKFSFSMTFIHKNCKNPKMFFIHVKIMFMMDYYMHSFNMNVAAFIHIKSKATWKIKNKKKIWKSEKMFFRLLNKLTQLLHIISFTNIS